MQAADAGFKVHFGPAAKLPEGHSQLWHGSGQGLNPNTPNPLGGRRRGEQVRTTESLKRRAARK
ncbi:hypothetical protein TspCOW1_24680 [Thiohalobacter sp. COW1]|nr:hypothetical protein TspCOW1_24680 [Thiohalobacter sp. COW1]